MHEGASSILVATFSRCIIVEKTSSNGRNIDRQNPHRVWQCKLDLVHLFLSKQGALAASQPVHDSQNFSVRLIFASTARERPSCCAPAAAPVRLPFPTSRPQSPLRLQKYLRLLCPSLGLSVSPRRRSGLNRPRPRAAASTSTSAAPNPAPAPFLSLSLSARGGTAGRRGRGGGAPMVPSSGTAAHPRPGWRRSPHCAHGAARPPARRAGHHRGRDPPLAIPAWPPTGVCSCGRRNPNFLCSTASVLAGGSGGGGSARLCSEVHPLLPLLFLLASPQDPLSFHIPLCASD